MKKHHKEEEEEEVSEPVLAWENVREELLVTCKWYLGSTLVEAYLLTLEPLWRVYDCGRA
jgi:hypothetical protein